MFRKPWGKNGFGKSGTAPPLGDSKYIHRVKAEQEKTLVLPQCFKPQTLPPTPLLPLRTVVDDRHSVVAGAPGDLFGTFNMVAI